MLQTRLMAKGKTFNVQRWGSEFFIHWNTIYSVLLPSWSLDAYYYFCDISTFPMQILTLQPWCWSRYLSLQLACQNFISMTRSSLFLQQCCWCSQVRMTLISAPVISWNKKLQFNFQSLPETQSHLCWRSQILSKENFFMAVNLRTYDPSPSVRTQIAWDWRTVWLWKRSRTPSSGPTNATSLRNVLTNRCTGLKYSWRYFHAATIWHCSPSFLCCLTPLRVVTIPNLHSTFTFNLNFGIHCSHPSCVLHRTHSTPSSCVRAFFPLQVTDLRTISTRHAERVMCMKLESPGDIPPLFLEMFDEGVRHSFIRPMSSCWHLSLIGREFRSFNWVPNTQRKRKEVRGIQWRK